MTTIRVLTPFKFCRANGDTTTPAVETLFTVGDHDIPDAIANHPWIVGLADGAIESPAQAAVRIAAEQAAAEQAESDQASG